MTEAKYMAQAGAHSDPRPDERLVPAALDRLRPCPARSDYVEVCFTTPAGPFQWCFPKPPPQSQPQSQSRSQPQPRARTEHALALTLGPYGVQAHELHGGVLGDALPSATALPMILGGAHVHVARRLLATAN